MKETVSVIVVNHNRLEFLGECFASLYQMDTSRYALEVIMVDNLSTDDSVQFVKESYPQVKILINDANSFARALNLGVANAGGSYIAFLNNDTAVDKEWMNGLMQVMGQDERIGAVQSKILFWDGETLNSVGAEEIEDFYFRDIGFGLKDIGQYAKAEEREYVSGGSILYRRQCLDEVGEFDEDYVMFFEDIDYSIRCRDRGWKLFYSPLSIVRHKFHGSASNELCEYLCSRNRLMLIAKRFPERLIRSIRTSHPYLSNRYDRLYWDILQAMKKLVEHNEPATVRNILGALNECLVDIYGISTAYRIFKHLEVVLGLRKIELGIYDHAFHFAGGGQRYVAKLAEILQDTYNVTYIANKDCTLEKYREWFDIDLSRCSLKIVKLPFYERLGGIFIDEGLARFSNSNYFDAISRESAHYDIFLNANMLSIVEPRSPLSIFMCHFPDRDRGKYFSVDQYDYVIANSEYTSSWVEKKWGILPTLTLYPPVDMHCPESNPERKEKIILSVARFEIGGSKKQLEMIRAFNELSRTSREIGSEWRLVLAGGSHEGNPYFEKILDEIERIRPKNIELRPNLTNDGIKNLYRRASIFWHACGLKETNPHLIEHFGMATVEAMRNFCVPITIDGGGQREIFEHGKSGYRFSSLAQLKEYTLHVIRDDVLRKAMAIRAYERGQQFSSDIFRDNLLAFMRNVENRLRLGIAIEEYVQRKL